MESTVLERKEKEVKRNYEAFVKMLPSLIEGHRGRHALMKDGKVIGIYSTVQDAVQTGELFCEDGVFSVQEITGQCADLGFYSHVVYIG